VAAVCTNLVFCVKLIQQYNTAPYLALFTLLQPTGPDRRSCARRIAFVSMPNPAIIAIGASTIPTTYAIPSVSLLPTIPYPTGIALTLDHLTFLSRYDAHVSKEVYLQPREYHPIVPLLCSSVLIFACSCSLTVRSRSAIAHLPLSRPPLCSCLSSPTCRSIPSLPILIPSSYCPLRRRVIHLFRSVPANPAIDHTCLPAFTSCPIPFPLSSPFSLFPAKSNFTWRTLNHAADIQLEPTLSKSLDKFFPDSVAATRHHHRFLDRSKPLLDLHLLYEDELDELF
jgi:hypothetical protein